MTQAAGVLVIDDDDSVRLMICALLEEFGVRTRATATGEEGLKMARYQRPELVLLDIHLPGISGYETCRALREQYAMSLPIIFLSGERTEAFDRVGGLLLGADDYITKPFAVDELLNRVRVLLRRPKGEGGLGYQLTRREAQVLSLLASGMDQLAIGVCLSISASTVGTHIERVLTKLGVQSRAQAVAKAYRDQMVERVACTAPDRSASRAFEPEPMVNVQPPIGFTVRNRPHSPSRRV